MILGLGNLTAPAPTRAVQSVTPITEETRQMLEARNITIPAMQMPTVTQVPTVIDRAPQVIAPAPQMLIAPMPPTPLPNIMPGPNTSTAKAVPVKSDPTQTQEKMMNPELIEPEIIDLAPLVNPDKEQILEPEVEVVEEKAALPPTEKNNNTLLWLGMAAVGFYLFTRK
jgi:hypothetical protein